MKTMIILSILLSTSVFAGTEVVYNEAKSALDYSLKVDISVKNDMAKLLLSKRTASCGYGATCTRYKSINIEGLKFNKQNETIEFKGTLCGTVRTEFIGHQGRTGKYMAVYSENGNCEISVKEKTKEFQVNITR